MFRIALLLLVACAAAPAVEVPETLVVNGQTYKAVVYQSHDGSRLRIMHETGIAALPIGDLPADLQGKLGYGEKAAQDIKATEQAKAAAAETAAAAAENQRIATEQANVAAAEAADKSAGLHIPQIKDALMGKTKSEVKEFFGRKPDDILGEDRWFYDRSYFDPDSETYMKRCNISFHGSNHHTSPNTVYIVSFGN